MTADRRRIPVTSLLRLGALALVACGASASAQPVRPDARVRVTLADTSIARAYGIDSRVVARLQGGYPDSLILLVPDGRHLVVPSPSVLRLEVSQGRSPWRHLAGVGGAVVGVIGGAMLGVAFAPESGGAAKGSVVGGVAGTFLGAHIGRGLAPERWRPVSSSPTGSESFFQQSGESRRWSVRATFANPAEGGAAIARYLSDEGFGDDRPDYGWFGGEIRGYDPRPMDRSDFITQTVTMTRDVRPALRLGVRGVIASRSEVDGYHQGAGDLRVARTMAAVLPVAEWNRGAIRVGAGAGMAWGETGETDYVYDPEAGLDGDVFLSSQTFVRPAAVAYAGVGGTLFGGHVALGLEAQYVYAGTAEIGPFAVGEVTADAGSVWLSQLSLGPVVGVRW